MKAVAKNLKIKLLTVMLLSLMGEIEAFAFGPIPRFPFPLHHLPIPRPIPQPFPPQPPPPAPVDDSPMVQMAMPSYGGPGCPNGTVQAVLSPDSTTISILFDQFDVQAGPSTHNVVAVTQCNIVIPLEIRNGNYMALVTDVDYRGSVSIPDNSKLDVIASYAMVDSNAIIKRPTGVNIKREEIVGPSNDDLYLSVTTPPSTSPIVRPGIPRIWSMCSNRPNLQINARLNLQNNNPSEDGLATMDSLDATIKSSLQYRLIWRACP